MKWVLLLGFVVSLAYGRTIYDYERDGLDNEQRGIPGKSVTGEYEWRAPDGKVTEVSYIADHLGFRLLEDLELRPPSEPFHPAESTAQASAKTIYNINEKSALEEEEGEEEEEEEEEEEGSGETEEEEEEEEGEGEGEEAEEAETDGGDGEAEEGEEGGNAKSEASEQKERTADAEAAEEETTAVTEANEDETTEASIAEAVVVGLPRSEEKEANIKNDEINTENNDSIGKSIDQDSAVEQKITNAEDAKEEAAMLEGELSTVTLDTADAKTAADPSPLEVTPTLVPVKVESQALSEDIAVLQSAFVGDAPVLAVAEMTPAAEPMVAPLGELSVEPLSVSVDEISTPEESFFVEETPFISEAGVIAEPQVAPVEVSVEPMMASVDEVSYSDDSVIVERTPIIAMAEMTPIAQPMVAPVKGISPFSSVSKTQVFPIIDTLAVSEIIPEPVFSDALSLTSGESTLPVLENVEQPMDIGVDILDTPSVFPGAALVVLEGQETTDSFDSNFDSRTISVAEQDQDQSPEPVLNQAIEIDLIQVPLISVPQAEALQQPAAEVSLSPVGEQMPVVVSEVAEVAPLPAFEIFPSESDIVVRHIGEPEVSFKESIPEVQSLPNFESISKRPPVVSENPVVPATEPPVVPASEHTDVIPSVAEQIQILIEAQVSPAEDPLPSPLPQTQITQYDESPENIQRSIEVTSTAVQNPVVFVKEVDVSKIDISPELSSLMEVEFAQSQLDGFDVINFGRSLDRTPLFNDMKQELLDFEFVSASANELTKPAPALSFQNADSITFTPVEMSAVVESQRAPLQPKSTVVPELRSSSLDQDPAGILTVPVQLVEVSVDFENLDQLPDPASELTASTFLLPAAVPAEIPATQPQAQAQAPPLLPPLMKASRILN